MATGDVLDEATTNLTVHVGASVAGEANKVVSDPLTGQPNPILGRKANHPMVAPAAKLGLLLLRCPYATFSRRCARFPILDFYASSVVHAFLAATAAGPDPLRVALVVAGGSVLVDAGFLDAMHSNAGVNHIALAGCASRRVAVAGAGKIFSIDVADHAVGLFVDMARVLQLTKLK